MPGAWWTVLAFEALCVDFASDSYSLADFATYYSARKLSSGVYSFIPRGGRQKLIINLLDSDHRWSNTVV